ncbi:hypothetical protein TNCV_902981 [Trichonephila clavipes]|nr:hypothetical protein TNCV_902981 [Trichonephila clavipes]
MHPEETKSHVNVVWLYANDFFSKPMNIYNIKSGINATNNSDLKCIKTLRAEGIIVEQYRYMVVARCWQQWIGRVYRRGGSERPRNTNDRFYQKMAIRHQQ